LQESAFLRYRFAVARTNFIELPDVEPIPILYEDRSALAIDKPRGWMLVPVSWQKTLHNLQAAINSSIAARDFWARSRALKYLRYVHRLDAETSGVLLFAKSAGALDAYSALFESRQMEKRYLAVVHGVPQQTEWTCKLKLAPDAKHIGKMKTDPLGKEAETTFRVLKSKSGNKATLVEARPLTGRTHQIRVHLAMSGHPIIGDILYGKRNDKAEVALRAVFLRYSDPFTRRRVEINAPVEGFCREYGFDTDAL
jgi:RluA family pseudouridine synthase